LITNQAFFVSVPAPLICSILAPGQTRLSIFFHGYIIQENFESKILCMFFFGRQWMNSYQTIKLDQEIQLPRNKAVDFDTHQAPATLVPTKMSFT